MRKYGKILMLLVVSGMLLSSGCVAVIAAGVAGVAYVNGEAKRSYAAGMDECKAGVEKSLIGLEYKIIAQTGDKLEYKFEARTGEDKAITVILKAATGDTTEIAVRVGVFGDKKKSMLIHEEFVKNIKERKSE